MKKTFLGLLIAITVVTCLGGCAWSIGDTPKQVTSQPTVGQQLIDLQKARDSGALTDAEYQSQKAKVLGGK